MARLVPRITQRPTSMSVNRASLSEPILKAADLEVSSQSLTRMFRQGPYWAAAWVVFSTMQSSALVMRQRVMVTSLQASGSMPSQLAMHRLLLMVMPSIRTPRHPTRCTVQKALCCRVTPLMANPCTFSVYRSGIRG